MRDGTLYTIALLLVAGIAALAFLTLDNNEHVDCIRKGGEPIRAYTSVLCLKKGTLVK